MSCTLCSQCTVLTDHSMAASRSFSILAPSTSPFDQTERPRFGPPKVWLGTHSTGSVGFTCACIGEWELLCGKLVDKFRNTFFIICEFHNSLGNRRTDRPECGANDGIIDERVNERMKQLLLSTKMERNGICLVASVRHSLADSSQTMSSGWR